MNKIIYAFAFKLPAILIILASFVAGVYATIKQLYGITYATPIFLGVILVSYFIGEFIEFRALKKKEV